MQRTITAESWRDPSRPAAERVQDLLGRMTLEEKAAQLTSIWIGDEPGGVDVAPMQGETDADPLPLAELIRDGIGQVTGCSAPGRCRWPWRAARCGSCRTGSPGPAGSASEPSRTRNA